FQILKKKYIIKQLIRRKKRRKNMKQQDQLTIKAKVENKMMRQINKERKKKQKKASTIKRKRNKNFIVFNQFLQFQISQSKTNKLFLPKVKCQIREINALCQTRTQA
ncbi:hypothetical protein TTHERM_002653517, partial (macronuclear) [Tetrahymena thermophila SB210]